MKRTNTETDEEKRIKQQIDLISRKVAEQLWEETYNAWIRYLHRNLRL